MTFKEGQIVEVKIGTCRGPACWLGQVIKVTPTRVRFYYLRQGRVGFNLVPRWAPRTAVSPASISNRKKWRRAVAATEALVRVMRAAVLEAEAEGYADSL